MAWNVSASREELAFLMEAGLIYRDAHRFDEAAAVFRGVRALLPQSEVPEVALGTLEFERGNLDVAVSHYENALKINAKSAYAHSHLAEAYFMRKNIAAAREHSKRAMELDKRGETGKFARSLSDLIDLIHK